MKAFPDPNNTQAHGMDLRDWFAGLAMQGLVNNQGEDFDPVFTVEAAYEIADEMMKARNEVNEQV
jgi:hypothetical protein